MFSSIGFGILYSTLTLFLIKNLHVEESIALSVVGVFIALRYGLSLINGLIVGRWTSYINALIIGILLQTISIFLIYQSNFNFILGCAIFLSGNLASFTSINMIITEHVASDQSREKAFFWNYTAMNLGNVLGYSIGGYSQLINNFKSINYIAVILMLVALVLSFIYKELLHDIHSHYSKLTNNKKLIGNIKFIVALVIITIFIKKILENSVISSTSLMVVISITVVLLLGYNYQISKNRNSITFIVLAISWLFFWSLYFLIPTGLTLFINYSTTGKLFGIAVTPAWLTNINSVMVIFGAPLLGTLFIKFDKKNQWTTIHKFIIGILFLALAFGLLVNRILFADTSLVSLEWVALTYVFISLSELFIAPIGFAAVGKYVSYKHQGIMTGMWIALLGLGGLIASKLSGFINITNHNTNQTNTSFITLFASLFALTLIFVMILYTFKSLSFKK